jgi:L-alanine-DL-glutamate epimerase-like enolase superfamily enzyme
MLQLRAYPASLPVEYPFTIAKGTKTEQPALLVSLGFGKLTGWGEATAISYYDVTVEGMMAALERARPVIERYSLTDPQRFWHFLHHLLPGENFLIAALDIAGWDLFAQLRRVPVYAALGLQNPGTMTTDYTIGIDTVETMIAKLKAHPAEVYKVKLARPDDIDLLRALRPATKAPFRIDVNEGWSYDETRRLLPELESLGVVLLEQPLPKAAWEEMQALKTQSRIPLFADESCVGEDDIRQCATTFHGVNIKLAKCGGITPAQRMIREARTLGLQVMLGSMNESSIGTSAAVHLGGAADLLDADGPLLLAEDHASGLLYDNGRISIGEGTGLCIRVAPRI